ncbi:MAG: MFS transporter, partial [Acidobacteria bacterium]|nr:MFS transporter [Acidobacteriota bacterium]
MNTIIRAAMLGEPLARPSRARGRVLAFAFLLSVVTYLDRICISAAAPYIMEDLQLTVLQMSIVFSAFTLAYSIFEVPSGWLGDRRGPHRVLTRIVLWWSGFTMLTGAARGFGSLVTIRFLFGAGEAGAFPNMARSFSRWFPSCERGQANGVMFFGSRAGGMLGAAGPAADYSLGLARQLRRIRRDRSRVGRGLACVVSRFARRSPFSECRGACLDPTGWEACRRPSRRHSMAAIARQLKPLGNLRDVLRVRVRAVLLFHVAAHLFGSRARVHDARRRLLCGAAVPAGRSGEPGRRVAHRLPRANPGAARGALLAGKRLFSDLRFPDVLIHHGRLSGRESGAARLRTGIGRPGARRVLGRAARYRRGPRGSH